MAKKDFIDKETDDDVQEETVEGTEDEQPETESEQEKPVETKPAPIDRIAYERELRRYVKSDGGFRKGLPESGIKRAKEIMRVLGRKKAEWDHSILVPGYDKPTVRNMNLGTGSKE